MSEHTYDPKQQRYTPPKYATAGKPTKYHGEETFNKAIEYIESCEDGEVVEELVEGPNGGKLLRRYSQGVNLPSRGGMAAYLGVSIDTLYDWGKAHTEFQDVINYMNAIRESRLTNGGLSGRYNSTITALMLGRHGYKKQVEVTDSTDKRPLKDLSKEQLAALANAELEKDAEDNTGD